MDPSQALLLGCCLRSVARSKTRFRLSRTHAGLVQKNLQDSRAETANPRPHSLCREHRPHASITPSTLTDHPYRERQAGRSCHLAFRRCLCPHIRHACVSVHTYSMHSAVRSRGRLPWQVLPESSLKVGPCICHPCKEPAAPNTALDHTAHPDAQPLQPHHRNNGQRGVARALAAWRCYGPCHRAHVPAVGASSRPLVTPHGSTTANGANP